MPIKNCSSLKVLAESYCYLLHAYHKCECVESKRWLTHLIKQGCRQIEKFISPVSSVAAQAVADDMGIGNICNYSWADQKLKMKDPDRSIFHFEHVYPVSDMFKDLVALEKISPEAVERILRKADIAWILKSENRTLDASGHRDGRPENPWDSYASCGIEIST